MPKKSKKSKSEVKFGILDENSTEYHSLLAKRYEESRAKEETTTLPTISEERGREWVSFGKDNLYPQSIMALKHQSALHDSLLDKKSKWMSGQGFSEDSIQDVQKLFNKKTTRQANSELGKITLDYNTFGGYYLHVIYNLGRKVDRVNIIPFQNVRTGKLARQKDGSLKVEKYFISNDWSQHRKDNFKPFEIPAFNPERAIRDRKVGQIMAVKRHESWQGQPWYASPDYLGGLNAIKIDAGIDRFHVANLKNGMFPNIHVHVPGDFTDDKKRNALADSIKYKYADKTKAGEPIITWSDSDSGQVKVTIIPSAGNHEMFLMLNKEVMLKLFITHKAPPAILGITDLISTGMNGGGLMMKEAAQDYQETEIDPVQSFIEESIQELMDINGGKDVEISPRAMKFSVSDQLREKTETINEIRADSGKPELEGGDVTPQQEINNGSENNTD